MTAPCAERIGKMTTPSARTVVFVIIATLLAILCIGCSTPYGVGKGASQTGGSIQRGTQ